MTNYDTVVRDQIIEADFRILYPLPTFEFACKLTELYGFDGVGLVTRAIATIDARTTRNKSSGSNAEANMLEHLIRNHYGTKWSLFPEGPRPPLDEVAKNVGYQQPPPPSSTILQQNHREFWRFVAACLEPRFAHEQRVRNYQQEKLQYPHLQRVEPAPFDPLGAIYDGRRHPSQSRDWTQSDRWLDNLRDRARAGSKRTRDGEAASSPAFKLPRLEALAIETEERFEEIDARMTTAAADAQAQEDRLGELHCQSMEHEERIDCLEANAQEFQAIQEDRLGCQLTEHEKRLARQEADTQELHRQSKEHKENIAHQESNTEVIWIAQKLAEADVDRRFQELQEEHGERLACQEANAETMRCRFQELQEEVNRLRAGPGVLARIKETLVNAGGLVVGVWAVRALASVAY